MSYYGAEYKIHYGGWWKQLKIKIAYIKSNSFQPKRRNTNNDQDRKKMIVK